MKTIAPPIVSGSELFGRENQLILVEYDSFDQILKLLENKIVFVMSLNADDFTPTQCKEWRGVMVEGISRAARIIKSSNLYGDDLVFLIHRIDLLDGILEKKSRGSLRKGTLSTFSPRLLRGANIIVTSKEDEYMLRQLADDFLNLKTQVL